MDVPTASIDAIVQIPSEQVSAAVTMQHSRSTSSGSFTPLNGRAIGEPQDEGQRYKGHKRLFQSLRSMASSPSLAKMAKIRPYRSGNRASMSCVSLSTSYAPPTLESLDTQLAQQFSTAPTSVTSSPGPSTPTRTRMFPKEGPTTIALPLSIRPSSPDASELMIEENDEGYFSFPASEVDIVVPERKFKVDFWNDMPTELRIHVLSFLTPKEIVRCSAVSRSWHSMCYDGQLWQQLDTSAYYRDIPMDALVSIINRAGPFVRDLNLRGCIQLRHAWTSEGIARSCKNLENFSLEGCLIDKSSIHSFLKHNIRLVHVNLTGLPGVSNDTMKTISKHCPKLEHLNITWCTNVSTQGLQLIVRACPNLKDLRAGETRGWDNINFAVELFKRNTLERLILTNCDSLTDDFVSVLMQGMGSEMDYITGRVICEPRKLKHLDLSRCKNLSDSAIEAMAFNVPDLEGLQLSKIPNLTDASLAALFPTLYILTHLDIEELDQLTNVSLQSLANSPSATTLRHLTISYCDNLSDVGMLSILKKCPGIESLDMDNTRISDLVLAEAAQIIRKRNLQLSATGNTSPNLKVGLRLAVYDCANVTWNGVLEVLSRNAEVFGPGAAKDNREAPVQPHYSHNYISLKAFYTWQPTITEHTKRVQAGHFYKAKRLERKWVEFMMMGEEAMQGGRRRRRRMREALAAMAGEHEDAGGRPMRRRARSEGLGGSGGSCVIM